MATFRYSKTNSGAYTVLQRRSWFGLSWRTIKFLETEERKAEEEMLAALKKFEEAAKKRMEMRDHIDQIRGQIEAADKETDSAGIPFEKASGFGAWIKSFWKEPLYPEQKTDWKEFYNILKSKGLLKSVVRKVTMKPTAVVVGTTTHELKSQQQMTKAERRAQGQQNNHQHNN